MKCPFHLIICNLWMPLSKLKYCLWIQPLFLLISSHIPLLCFVWCKKKMMFCTFFISCIDANFFYDILLSFFTIEIAISSPNSATNFKTTNPNFHNTLKSLVVFFFFNLIGFNLRVFGFVVSKLIAESGKLTAINIVKKDRIIS